MAIPEIGELVLIGDSSSDFSSDFWTCAIGAATSADAGLRRVAAEGGWPHWPQGAGRPPRGCGVARPMLAQAHATCQTCHWRAVTSSEAEAAAAVCSDLGASVQEDGCLVQKANDLECKASCWAGMYRNVWMFAQNIPIVTACHFLPIHCC